ncbi:MAG TPA: ABC transporter ATP-binding protein [Stellaceae bacterium]|nr:ABC transporter ATP-binding protein [Stellaceae bacterium]
MSSVSLISLSKSYGDHVVVRDFSLEISDGEFLVLLGPSGCGKTTTLRMIAGFVEPSAGRVLFGSRDVTELPPYRRNTGLVFQGYALFPHLTVFENVAFGLRMRKLDKASIERRTVEALRLVRLDQLAARMPRQLSGGQQQRVALARALVIEPEILLLDEPLSNLDAKLREEVRLEIRQLQRRLGLTTVMVTHDQEEALSVADRLVVMSEGEIQQIGTQRELYNAPHNRFVANFIGRTNLFAGALTAPMRFQTESGLSIALPTGTGEQRLIAVRPERIRIGAAGLANRFSGTIEFASYLGATTDYVVRLASGDLVAVEMHNTRTDGVELLAVGTKVEIGWDPEACQLIQ